MNTQNAICFQTSLGWCYGFINHDNSAMVLTDASAQLLAQLYDYVNVFIEQDWVKVELADAGNMGCPEYKYRHVNQHREAVEL